MSITLTGQTVVVLTDPTAIDPDFTTYDGYLDNLGLIYYEAEGAKKETRLIPLRPSRVDTGGNPAEQRPEVGDWFAQMDFSGGGGQTFFHRPGRDEKKFYHAEGYDVTDPQRLTHLHQAALARASAGLGAIAIAADLPFIADGNDVRRGDGAFPGTWTIENPHLAEPAVAVEDLEARGEMLYAALGVNGIHERDGAGTWTHYSDIQATLLAFVKDRLMAADGRRIYEVAAGPAPSPLETLPEGWRFTSICEGGEFIYACAVSEDAQRSRIHRYGLNDQLTLEKKGSTPMPDGQLAHAGLGYLDAIYIGAGRRNDSGGYDPVLYQALADGNGRLQLVKMREDFGSGALDLSVKALQSSGESVIFGWSLTSGSRRGPREGLAIHHLGRDAIVNYLKKNVAADPPRAVTDIAFYKGRLLFTVGGEGLYYEDLTKLVGEAEIHSSIADWNTVGEKSWDEISVAHRALPAGAEVGLDYSLKHPDEDEWGVGVLSTVFGSQGARDRLIDAQSRLFAVRLHSKSSQDGSNAPEPIGFQVRSFPFTPRPEFKMSRFVRILGRDRKDQLGEPITQDPDSVRRRLHLLAHQTVVFVEPDTTWTVRVTDVADVAPQLPLLAETEGEPEQSAYVMRIELEGTRNDS